MEGAESTSRAGSHVGAVLGGSQYGRNAIGLRSTDMTSGPHVHAGPASVGQRQLRLRLKPQGPTTGHVDGGWWPRSRDLAAELPALAGVLAVRLGVVHRVVFAMAAWGTTPRRLEIDGWRVRLEGFRFQDKDIVHVIGLDGRRVTLLVVPPEAADAAGHDAMMAAGLRNNADSPATILAMAGVSSGEPIPRPRVASDGAEDRWEVDGGRVREHD